MVQQFKARLLEGEAVVPTMTPKAWIPGFFPGLHPAKESLESQIHTLLNILQDLREHRSQFRMFLLPEGEQFIGIVQRKGFVLLLPGGLSRGESLRVDPSAHLQRLKELCALAPGWLQADILLWGGTGSDRGQQEPLLSTIALQSRSEVLASVMHERHDRS